MFKDHLKRKDGGFDHQVAKVPENAVGEERPLLGRPDAIAHETCNDEDREESCRRVEDPSGNGEIIIEIEAGGVWIEEEGDIVEDNTELGKEPFGESEVPNLVAFDDVIEIAFPPDEEN
jgi:hypothetical protein